MRTPAMALVAALALVATAFAAQSPPDKPVERVTLPAALAKRLGPELPDVVWIGIHPSRNDGAWVLLGNEWTLVTGLAAEARAEIKEARKAARKRPSQTPPVRPPNVGVTLRVVRFERP